MERELNLDDSQIIWEQRSILQNFLIEMFDVLVEVDGFFPVIGIKSFMLKIQGK